MTGVFQQTCRRHTAKWKARWDFLIADARTEALEVGLALVLLVILIWMQFPHAKSDSVLLYALEPNVVLERLWRMVLGAISLISLVGYFEDLYGWRRAGGRVCSLLALSVGAWLVLTFPAYLMPYLALLFSGFSHWVFTRVAITEIRRASNRLQEQEEAKFAPRRA